MTLSRQLLLLISALVAALLLGSLAISVSNTRGYLESQLASHAQDAATSLGLSATSHVEQEDRAMVTAMVNAMFHRGDYLSIRFQDLDGNSWVERTVPLRVDGVPAWFVDLLRLESPQGSAVIMSGWRQVGRVLVRSHPGLAYRKLWQTARHTLNLFLATAAGVLLVGLLGLRRVLHPLRQIERQAEAVCNREFPVVEDRPSAPELRRVVDAMNRLSGRVSRMLDESERLAARLRSQAFQDPVTGLANRRQFMNMLEDHLADPQMRGAAGLLLVRLHELEAVNQAAGYPAGDRLLREAGGVIESALRAGGKATVAHLAGADFAVLLEGVNGEALQQQAERVAAATADLYRMLALPSPDVAHVGAALFDGQSPGELLAAADTALREAQRWGPNRAVVRISPMPQDATRSVTAWRALIVDALDRHDFELLQQPVLRCADRALMHHEVFLRMPDPERSGTRLMAAELVPAAERAGLATALDRAVLGRVLHGIEGGRYPGRVAVNLTPMSLDDLQLLDWLATELARRVSLNGRLVVELPEYGATGRSAALKAWIDRLRGHGVRFAIDQFGRGFAGFTYLRALHVDYLKIDGSYVRRLDEQDDNRFILRTIADIAHGLDMQAIAESVETEAVWEAVCATGLDGGRGHWLGRPA